jgi:hypothetical protein
VRLISSNSKLGMRCGLSVLARSTIGGGGVRGLSSEDADLTEGDDLSVGAGTTGSGTLFPLEKKGDTLPIKGREKPEKSSLLAWSRQPVPPPFDESARTHPLLNLLLRLWCAA